MLISLIRGEGEQELVMARCPLLVSCTRACAYSVPGLLKHGVLCESATRKLTEICMLGMWQVCLRRLIGSLAVIAGCAALWEMTVSAPTGEKGIGT